MNTGCRCHICLQSCVWLFYSRGTLAPRLRPCWRVDLQHTLETCCISQVWLEEERSGLLCWSDSRSAEQQAYGQVSEAAPSQGMRRLAPPLGQRKEDSFCWILVYFHLSSFCLLCLCPPLPPQAPWLLPKLALSWRTPSLWFLKPHKWEFFCWLRWF